MLLIWQPKLQPQQNKGSERSDSLRWCASEKSLLTREIPRLARGPNSANHHGGGEA